MAEEVKRVETQPVDERGEVSARRSKLYEAGSPLFRLSPWPRWSNATTIRRSASPSITGSQLADDPVNPWTSTSGRPSPRTCSTIFTFASSPTLTYGATSRQPRRHERATGALGSLHDVDRSVLREVPHRLDLVLAQAHSLSRRDVPPVAALVLRVRCRHVFPGSRRMSPIFTCLAAPQVRHRVDLDQRSTRLVDVPWWATWWRSRGAAVRRRK